ncbi:MAG TPA: hypothetical protein VML75_12645 [Kofleriaceae bacterium]|nr:hypothetical protein [Kofleriaceae bacterium]
MIDQRHMGRLFRSLAVAAGLTLYAVWTCATWLLEGRIETLPRPEAALDRAIYAIIANLLIGIVGAMAVLRVLISWRSVEMPAAGFGRSGSSAVRTMIGLALGLTIYVLQGAPSLDPIVVANAFSQVLVVSAAEVVVCWAVVGAVAEAVLRSRGQVISIIGAALVASTLFGLYHFAHSAPFNTPGMVALLSVVGLLTSAVFFIVRDIYATIAFHNFLGVFGVVQALAATGQLGAITALQPPLLIMAAATVGVLWLSERTLLRGRPSGS